MGANTIDIDFGSLNLNDTNDITIKNIGVKENKPVKRHDIPKTDGAIAETAKRANLTVSVSGDIAGSDYDALRTNLDTLKSGLQNGMQKFTTDDDRYIMGQLRSFSYKYGFLRRWATWKASFIAHYPFWLAESETTDDRTPTSGVGYTINNAGNAPTRVKIEVTAPGGGISDNIQIENTTRGELCKYRGDVTATEKLEIDNRYDTDDFEVLNNAVDDHKNFEGDFIMLSPGNNTIEFTGTAGTAVKLYYGDAWY